MPKTWDSQYTYSAGQITQYNGRMWICIEDDKGTEPGTDNAIWEVFVERYNSWNGDIPYPVGVGVGTAASSIFQRSITTKGTPLSEVQAMNIGKR